MPIWASFFNQNTMACFRPSIRRQSHFRRISKLLIANRGEIACRIMRTANRLGIKTVAVYSTADEHALHVALADEAHLLGPPPAAHSYLLADKLLDIAHSSRCEAVHPGYGFLSENVEFATECQRRNIAFVGPPASAIRDMGIKSRSKQIMAAAGVPVVPGYHGDDQGVGTLRAEAARIGYPVMVKAVRGGGGKGMRVAGDEGEFEAALESAKSEAMKAFGDDVVLLERFVAEPRHVEVQVFGDQHGNVVHLFERDCSVQRRHQKIVEEAPAPGLSASLRGELGAAAVRAAKAVGYVSAGTVEFILDRRTHDFHFMEMNTRLQVEHPITEMITGTDLVEWQLRVANGEKLPLTQDEIALKGHSFEARIYAEDPSGGFLPGAGHLAHLSAPPLDQTSRIETGVREGDEVSVHYDPMIAKLVVWDEDRSGALSKLQNLLCDYNIAGLETNINFLLDLAQHPEFQAGNVHTNFIQDNYSSLFVKKVPSQAQWLQAVIGVLLHDEEEDKSRSQGNRDQFNPFIVESGFRVNYKLVRDVTLTFRDTKQCFRVKFEGNGTFSISLDEGQTWSNVTGTLSKNNNRIVLRSTINGMKSSANIYHSGAAIVLFDQAGKTEFGLEERAFLSADEEEPSSSSQDKAVSPMPGVLDKVLVQAGDAVAKGDPLFVIIAMKMEFVVKAGRDAKIAEVFYAAGAHVQKDATIVQFEEEKSASSN